MLNSAKWQIGHSGWRMFALFLGFQTVATFVALPVIGWMFRSVLSSAGLHGVDMNTVGAILTVPASLAMFMALIVVAMMVMSLQLALLLLATARLRSMGTFTLRELGADAARLLRKLFRPGSLALLLYLFVILPLSQFGFLSALTRTISIPNFISGELVKTMPGLLGLLVLLLLLFILNVRLALVLPIFALTETSGFQAYRVSWRLTRRAFFPLVAALAIVFAAANITGFVLIVASTLPTLASDAIAPGLSPVVAAVGLGMAEVVGLLTVGFAVAALCAALLEFFHRAMVLAPGLTAVIDLARGGGAQATPAKRGRSHGAPTNRRGTMAVTALITLAIAALAIVNVPVMEKLQVTPSTLVVAHRGFVDGGVENTIGALEAAASAGADLVEMDVMETKDAQFVVMHDANLQRLSGSNLNVADLTLAEITAIEVRDGLGHGELVPSLQDYLSRAKELQMPLLVEIKLHGQEGPNLVPRLVAEMESLDAFSNNIFHSLSLPSVEELKRLRPSAYAGYIMALAGVAVPETAADFIVVEEWSYSTDLRDDAWSKGKELYVWTINTDVSQRQMLRDEVNALVTDHPDTALAHREGIGAERGLSGNLRDAIKRFVTVF